MSKNRGAIQRQQRALLASGEAIPGLLIEMQLGEIAYVGDNIRIQMSGASNGRTKIRIDAPGFLIRRPRGGGPPEGFGE